MGDWIGLQAEIDGVQLAARNLRQKEGRGAAKSLANYVYSRCSAYVGGDHQAVSENLISAAISAWNRRADDPHPLLNSALALLHRIGFAGDLRPEGWGAFQRKCRDFFRDARPLADVRKALDEEGSAPDLERLECARCGKRTALWVPRGNPNVEVCGNCHIAIFRGIND